MGDHHKDVCVHKPHGVTRGSGALAYLHVWEASATTPADHLWDQPPTSGCEDTHKLTRDLKIISGLSDGLSLVENCGAVSRRPWPLAQDVSDRGGRSKEDQHGSPLCGRVTRRQRSCTDSLGHCQNHCVSRVHQSIYKNIWPRNDAINYSEWIIFLEPSKHFF